MATYLSRDVYTQFKGNEDLSAIADQFHSTLDAQVPPIDAPTSSDSLTNPLGTAGSSPDLTAGVSPAVPPQPLPDEPPPPPAAAPPAVSTPAPVTAPLVAPASMQPAAAPSSSISLDDIAAQFHQGLDFSVRNGGTAPPAQKPITPTPAVISQAVASVAPPPTTGNGPAVRTSQFGLGLSSADAYAACGPTAAIAFAQTYGRNPSAAEAMGMAAQVGWTSGQGMAGVSSEQALLKKMGIATKLEDTVNWAHVEADASAGNPVILDTPGHYWYVSGTRKGSNGTEFNVGTSGTDLKGGSQWMTADQIGSTSMGAVRAALYADNPTSPTPSVANTAGLSGGGDLAGKIGDAGKAILNAAGTASSWLGDQGTKALQAVLVTEGGLNKARGDNGQSAGPLQFYEGGQLANFAQAKGLSLADAKTYVENNPNEAVQWAIGTPDKPGYLGAAILAGQKQGLTGPDLATYAQQHGQVSVSPERAGQNFSNLFGPNSTGSFSGGGGTSFNTGPAAPAPASSNPFDLGQIADQFHKGLDTTVAAAGQAKDAVGTNLSDIANNFHQGLNDTLNKVTTGPVPDGIPVVSGAGNMAANAINTVGDAVKSNIQNDPSLPAVVLRAVAGGESPLVVSQDLLHKYGTTMPDDSMTPEDKARAENLIMAIGGVEMGGAKDATDAAGNAIQPLEAQARAMAGRMSPADLVAAIQKYPEDIQATLRGFVKDQGEAGASGKSINDTLRQYVSDNPPTTDAAVAPRARTAPEPAPESVPAPAAMAKPPEPATGFDAMGRRIPAGQTVNPQTAGEVVASPSRPGVMEGEFDAQGRRIPPWNVFKQDVAAPTAESAPAAESSRYQDLFGDNAPQQTFDINGNQVTGASPGTGTRAPKITAETDLGPAIGKFADLQEAPPKAPFDMGKTAWGALAEAKKTLFSLSNFHVGTVAQGTLYGPAGAQGAAEFIGAYAKGLVKPGGTAARASGDLAEWFQKTADAGLIRNVGENPDAGPVAKGALSPIARAGIQAGVSGITSGSAAYTAAKSGGASDEDALKAGLVTGGVAAVLGPTVAQSMHTALWTEAVPLAKVLTFKAAVQGGVPEAEAAMFTKNLLGGQNLEAIAGQTGAKIARLVVMAPDWLLSQSKLIRDAGIGAAKSVPGVENLPKVGPMTGSQQLSRDWMLKAVGTGLMATEALQFAFTGHFTNENSAGHAFELEVPTAKGGNTTVSLFPGNIQGELDLLSNRDPGRFAENRLGVAGTVGNVIANQQFPGSHKPIYPAGSAFPEQAKDVAGYAASRYASMGLTSPVQQNNQGAPLPLIGASLLAGLKIGHTSGVPGGTASRSAPAPARGRTAPAPRAPARTSSR